MQREDDAGAPLDGSTQNVRFWESNDLFHLAMAGSTRLNDRAREEERLGLLEKTLSAGREADAALHAWLTRMLSEYRGSLSAWDLQRASDELATALAQFALTVRESAARLRMLLADSARDGNSAE